MDNNVANDSVVNDSINSAKQIKLGAIMSYIAVFFNIATGLVYTPWMVRQIGQSDYGLYSLALTLIGFFALDFGLGEAVSRFLSRFNAKNQEEKKETFLGVTFKIYFIIDIIIFIAFVLVFLFADIIYAELTAVELSKFRIVFLIAAIYSVTSFPFMPLNGVLISSERFTFYKFTELLNKVITVVTMVVVLMLGFRLYSLVLVNAASGAITIIAKLLYIKKHKLMKVDFKAKDKSLLKDIFNFSVWITIIAIAQRFILNITPTVLGAVAGSVQISLFAVANSIEGYTWTFANALNGLFLPRVTRMTVNNDSPREIEDLMIKVGRIQLIMVGLLIIGFLSMGREFMVLWMGPEFADSYFVTMMLILPCIITLTQQIGNTALVAVNEVKYRAFCSVVVAIISFSLSLVLSRYWGAKGSGIAIFIGNIIGQVIGLNIVYSKVLKINVFRFFKECHVKMCIPIILTAGIGFLIQHYFPVQHLMFFMIKVGVLCMIYFVIVWISVLNRYEKDLFLQLFRKVLRR